MLRKRQRYALDKCAALYSTYQRRNVSGSAQEAMASSSSSSSWNASRIAGTVAGLLVFPTTCYFTLKRCGMLDIPPSTSHDEPDQEEDIIVGDVTLVNKISLGGPFEMTDCRTGNRVTDKDLLLGKWTMLYFGFTRCAEICPSTMRFMQSMYETAKTTYKGKYDEEVDKMQVLFVSVDHIRDKPSDLTKFLAKYNVPSRGVVPRDREDVEGATRPWRVYISSVDETDEERIAREAKGLSAPDPTADNYQLDHSAAIYFVGPDGKLKDYFFKEIPVAQAVDRLSLHFENVYGLDK